MAISCSARRLLAALLAPAALLGLACGKPHGEDTHGGPATVALSDDAAIAAWTTKVEAAFYPTLDLERMARGLDACLNNACPSEMPARDPESATRAAAAWRDVVSAELPRDNHLRLRAAEAAALVLGEHDPPRGATLAEDNDLPDLAARLYQRAGMTAEAARAHEAALAADRARAAFQKRYGAPPGQTGQTAKDAPTTPWEWVTFLTSGPRDPWVRGCKQGASAFLAHVPPNAHLRRALLVMYEPCRECAFSHMEGELDVIEPMLRLTAEAFPLEVVRTWAALMSGPGHTGYSDAVPWISGDSGPTGNVLPVLHDVVLRAPQARESLLAFATESSRSGGNPGPQARWSGVVAYLTDGAPEPNEEVLLAKLAGSDTERRWALAWLPTKLQETEGRRPIVQNPSEPLRSAITGAWHRASSLMDRLLVLDALHSMPPPTGVDVLVRATASGDDPVRHLAMDAFMRQFQAAQRSLTGTRPFFDSLPEMRRILYPLLCRSSKDAWQAVPLFAELWDTQLDSTIAGCLKAMVEPDRALLGMAADGVTRHRALGWRLTTAALREIAARPGFADAGYVARLVDDIDAGR